MIREISAGGVVYRKRGASPDIQLIEDRFGKITLAKGKMEPGETVEQTALREIREETGLTGTIVESLAVIAYTYESEKTRSVQKEVHYYLVEESGGDLAAQVEEIAGVGWYSPQEAWRLQLSRGYENNNDVLLSALRKLGVEPEPVA